MSTVNMPGNFNFVSTPRRGEKDFRKKQLEKANASRSAGEAKTYGKKQLEFLEHIPQNVSDPSKILMERNRTANANAFKTRTLKEFMRGHTKSQRQFIRTAAVFWESALGFGPKQALTRIKPKTIKAPADYVMVEPKDDIVKQMARINTVSSLSPVNKMLDKPHFISSLLTLLKFQR